MDPLELTREQRAAAQACGCALIPATDEQVRRLTMQRRVFRLDGEPVLATRDGGYFETHGTLAALIGKHAAVFAGRGAARDRPRPHDRAAASDADPAAASGPGPAQTAIPGIGPPTPAADPSPMPEPCPQGHAAEALEPGAQGDGAAVSAADAEEEVATPVEGSGAEGDGAPAQLRAARTPRQRRAGQPKTPRWVTAGKERRGRLK
jgi:hypothetical protein